MSTVFVDTSFFIALASPRDINHRKAIDLATKHEDSELITTDFVLVELGNFFSRSNLRSFFLDITQDIETDRRNRTIPATRELLNRGIELYTKRSDKNWSLTDCISFAVMQEHGITEALTADQHFEQAGFVPLLV